MPGIEPGLLPPQGSVLPVYYTPLEVYYFLGYSSVGKLLKFYFILPLLAFRRKIFFHKIFLSITSNGVHPGKLKFKIQSFWALDLGFYLAFDGSASLTINSESSRRIEVFALDFILAAIPPNQSRPQGYPVPPWTG